MSVRSEVKRNVGHPWSNQPGFDLLFLQADTPEEMDTAFAAAKRKFWEVWLCGNAEYSGKPACVLYKPCGADAPWGDTENPPNPGNPS